LSVEQVEDLNRKLSNLRHDLNNQLCLITATVELIRHEPQSAQRRMTSLGEQPVKIAAALAKFTSEFEEALHISRP